MKYMNFNNACPFTCIANMLEKFHHHFEDKDIILASKLPYMYYANKETYLTGDMLQTKIWFDLFLHQYQLEFIELESSKNDLIDFLEQTHEEVMVGLSFEHMKHAVVFKGYSDNQYRFIYPHRKDDLHNDYIYLKKEAIESKLEDLVTYGYLQYNAAIKGPNLKLYDDSILYFRKYQSDFLMYLFQIKSMEDIINAQDTMFRPLLLTTYHMMNLTENFTLAKKIGILQKQFISLIKSTKTNILLYRVFDYKLLKEVFFDLEQLIQEQLKNF